MQLLRHARDVSSINKLQQACRLPARPAHCPRRAAVRAAAAPVTEAARGEAPPSALTQDLEQHMQQGSAASPSGRVILESAEELRSTTEHRLWVASTAVALAATVAEGLSKVDSLGSAAAAGAAVLTAYVVADFASGVYHWIVDNYGDGQTPVLGSQIAAFQGHHQRPWTITEREFCNNIHLVCKPALPVATLSLLAAHFLGTPVFWDVFISTGTLLVCLSQQSHAWSHMKRSELPAAVVALQEAGLLISRRDHGAHHKPPFDGNYSIVSGLTNAPLDGAGFYRGLERAVHALTGAAPRSWYDTPEEWREQQRPAQ